MKVDIAAFDTLCLWRSKCKVSNPIPDPLRSENGTELSHIHWMLRQIIENEDWKNDKANRWLGYAQAILVFCRILKLDDCKKINKQS